MGKTCRMSRITASAHNKALKLFLMSQKSQKRLEDLLVKNVQEGAPAQPLVHPESKRLRIRTIKSSLKDGHCTTKVFSGALGKLLEETSANAKLGNSNDAMNLYMGPLVAEEEQVMRVRDLAPCTLLQLQPRSSLSLRRACAEGRGFGGSGNRIQRAACILVIVGGEPLDVLVASDRLLQIIASGSRIVSNLLLCFRELP